MSVLQGEENWKLLHLSFTKTDTMNGVKKTAILSENIWIKKKQYLCGLKYIHLKYQKN
jgi:hypothetical protein